MVLLLCGYPRRRPAIPPSPAIAHSNRIDDEIAAPGMLQMVQRMDLAGHLQRIAIDRIMPAFDVDGAGPAGKPQLGNDVGPVGCRRSPACA